MPEAAKTGDEVQPVKTAEETNAEKLTEPAEAGRKTGG